MKQSTWDKLNELFSESPILKASPVAKEELLKAENVLDVEFSQDYDEFIKTYGGAIVGSSPIYGLRQAGSMDHALYSVVDVTLHYRNEGWPEVDYLYVFSSDNAGNPIGAADDGSIITYDHEFGEKIVLAESFEEYLLKCLPNIL